MPQSVPFNTNLLKSEGAFSGSCDTLPACYQGPDGPDVPGKNVREFLVKELSLGKLEVLKYLWLAGVVRPAKPLHEQILIGREIVVTERMDLHLIWASDGQLFIKPLPRFLLEPELWRTYLCCPADCICDPPVGEVRNSNSNNSRNDSLSRDKVSGQTAINSSSHPPKSKSSLSKECSRKQLWMCAMGFLASYACLISYESDFDIACEKRLLPRPLSESPSGWEDWKKFVSEVLSHEDIKLVHPRFLRAELRLSRLDTIHRLTQMPPFEPYLRHYWDYGSLFRDNIKLLATATIFIVLILTAMQVGLATEQLGQSKSFMAASYGFAVFAIIGPLCAFGLVVIEVLWHLAKNLTRLFWHLRKGGETVALEKGTMLV